MCVGKWYCFVCAGVEVLPYVGSEHGGTADCFVYAWRWYSFVCIGLQGLLCVCRPGSVVCVCWKVVLLCVCVALEVLLCVCGEALLLCVWGWMYCFVCEEVVLLYVGGEGLVCVGVELLLCMCGGGGMALCVWGGSIASCVWAWR